MNDDWATIRARRVLEKFSDGAAMNERVEEIRRFWARPWTQVWAGVPSDLLFNVHKAYDDVGDLLAALAQAERERDDSTYGRLLKAARDERDATRAEVERLKGELNEAKEEVRRQVEVRVLDQGRHPCRSARSTGPNSTGIALLVRGDAA